MCGKSITFCMDQVDYSRFPPLAMSRSILFSAFITAIALSACGVDTTGLSAESSRYPMGMPSSAVIVMEYADLQCPACKATSEQIVKPLMEQYGSRIRLDFKHFPLQGLHAFALEAAMASECAADQGKFWEFIDLSYANQQKLSSTALREWATTLQLDGPLFERCVSSGIKKKTVLADYAEGDTLGVNSTPTFFVNGKKVVIQQTDDLKTAVEAALAQAASAPL